MWIFCLFVFCLFLLKTTEYNFIQNYQLKKSVFELEDCVTEIKDSLQFLWLFKKTQIEYVIMHKSLHTEIKG